MMCAPRSAVPDVATAKSRPDTTSASPPATSGDAMPMRQPSAAERAPTHWTSPPPFTTCAVDPAAVSSDDARSTAQPFTYPDGSNWPHGDAVKYPPDKSPTAAHAATTSATSGAQASTVVAPRASRDTSLSPMNGEKTRSTQCSHLTAASSEPSARAAAARSKETTVPMTRSACRSRAVTDGVAWLTRGRPARSAAT
jgi:hypothetical protein